MSENSVKLTKNIPVAHTCDVLVVGGGLGGVAAAIASARAGAKTILMERNTFLGGVATAGHCCSVFNCMFSHDHELLVKGLPFEITQYLAEHAGPGVTWQKHRGHVIYDVELGKLALMDMVTESGVKVLLGAACADAIVEDGEIRGVVFVGRNGLEAVSAKRVIDATGDSDVAALAGSTIKTMHGKSTYCFRVGNVDVDRFIQYFIDHPGEYPDYMDIEWTFDDALAQYRENGTFLFPHGGGHQLSLVKQACADGRFSEVWEDIVAMDAMQMHAIRKNGTVHFITGFFTLDTLNSDEMSMRIQQGKRMAVHVTNFLRDTFPGFENCYLCSAGEDLGIRTSRYIEGEYVYESKMRKSAYRFPDSVGRALIVTSKTLNAGEGAWGCQLLGDDYTEVPLRALLPTQPAGLIMGAGRSISAQNPGVLRVMVNTMVIGQGAGIAAAVSALENTAIGETDYVKIREELVRQNVYPD